MTKLKSLIVSTIMLTPALSGFAATDTVVINMNTTYTPYVKFTGTAPGTSQFYGNNEIANWIFPSIVNLGTLGLESNIGGLCDINFSTQNDFALLHTVSGNPLTQYKVVYQSTDFGLASNPTLTTPCTSIPTSMEFTPTQIVWGNLFPSALIESGIYQDTVNITVTTQ